MYIYVTDKNVRDKLLSQNCKMITCFECSDKETWVFEYDPSLFSISESSIDNECFISKELLMCF